MGSGASKSGGKKADDSGGAGRSPESSSSSARTSKSAVVKRGSVDRKSNGGGRPETPRGSKREQSRRDSSMKRNTAMESGDTRGSSIRAMRGTINKRGSFADPEDGTDTRPSNSGKSGKLDRHSIGVVTSGGGGGYGLVSVVNNVVTTMKDSTGNGTTEVASHVQNSEVGLLVIALPSAAGVSEFVTDILVKATCPILFVRPSGN